MSNIEVVNLERGERYDGADRPLAPFVSGAGHVVYAPWDAAEREVKARALCSLAARQTPPDGVAFVRTWEQTADTSAQVQTFGLTREAAAFAPSPEALAEGAAVLSKRGRRAR